ncbi:MAG: thiamine-monophosphate kinase [Kiritimatiellia bacterium]|nr:thiamine-phosphate kinase [Lentisphaerota bacterium]
MKHDNKILPPSALAGELGELALIGLLCRDLPTAPDVIVGPGDDCAVVRPAENTGCDWLLKSDPVIENVHFMREDDAVAVGHKALGRVLSDIAAMGGRPRWINVNLTAPADVPVRRLTGFYQGINDLARRCCCAVAGGDLSVAPHTALHVFGVGSVPRGRAILRSGARPGDVIHVTGALGGSRSGRHLFFEPRLCAGQWLCSGHWATAMIDISDGLAADLRRLAAASDTGAQLDPGAIPCSNAARQAGDGRSALEHALGDGEDFELLFTVAPEKAAAMARAWPSAWDVPCTPIGVITPASQGLTMRRLDGGSDPLAAGGYEHFR